MPEDGSVSPKMRSMSVDFPAPLVPSNATISPGAMETDTSLSARTECEEFAAKTFSTSRTLIAGEEIELGVRVVFMFCT